MYYVQFCINIKCDFKIRQQTDEFLQQYSVISWQSVLLVEETSTRRKTCHKSLATTHKGKYF